MAYFSQEMKAQIAPKIKAIASKYGIKVSLSVKNHMEVVLTISSGKLDFIGNRNEIAKEWAERRGDDFYETKGNFEVNHYHIDSQHSGEVAKCLNELNSVLNTNNYDNSDIQTDYFDVGYYVSIKVGRWNKPYVLVA